MPAREADGSAIVTRIVRNPGGRDFPPVRPREPFGRHALIGGNTWVFGLFRGHRDVLGVSAAPEEFQATIGATREQL